jgi:hypothetical protein
MFSFLAHAYWLVLYNKTIVKELLAAIVAFFTSIFSFGQPQPLSSPSPTAIATPLPTPAYSRASYTNQILNYSFQYPDDTTLQESPDRHTVWDETYTLRFDEYTGPLDMESLLDTDLMCNADSPGGSVSCKNTAIKPFTNQSGTLGFLIRRTKVMTGIDDKTFADTAYVFPLTAGNAIIISVEYPSPENLTILTDTANWFTALL